MMLLSIVQFLCELIKNKFGLSIYVGRVKFIFFPYFSIIVSHRLT